MFFAYLATPVLLMCRNASYSLDNKSLLNIKMEIVEVNSSPIVYFVVSHVLLPGSPSFAYLTMLCVLLPADIRVSLISMI